VDVSRQARIARPPKSRHSNAWLDQIEFSNPKGWSEDKEGQEKSIWFYGRRVPAVLIQLAISSDTSPTAIIKRQQQLKRALQILAKEPLEEDGAPLTVGTVPNP
jgi:hypothetical protein